MLPLSVETAEKPRDLPPDSGFVFPNEDTNALQLNAGPQPASHFTPPPQPETKSPASVSLQPRFNISSLIAKIAIVCMFVVVLLFLVFTIFNVLNVLAGSDYTFNDEYAPGYSANQLRGIRNDLAFFKLLVLFVLVERTFTRMVRSFQPQPDLKSDG